MKTTYLWFGLLAVLIALLMASCSDDRTPVDYQTHPSGWTDPASNAFHGHDRTCGDCHRPDYATAVESSGCRSCHAEMTVDAVCSACHATPPTSNDGLPRGFEAGAAGAHAKHAGYACTECHAGVSTYNFSHIDNAPADVTFAQSEIAKLAPFNNPGYTHSGNPGSGNGTCSNLYCHSNGNGSAQATVPAWVGGHIACGDCHLLPPPAPLHPQDNVCHHCHTNVDPTSDYSTPGGIRFIDPSLHVNGHRNL
jgi:predicted CxxxxCH...CXXCH cytochrome family protein